MTSAITEAIRSFQSEVRLSGSMFECHCGVIVITDDATRVRYMGDDPYWSYLIIHLCPVNRSGG